MSVEQLNRRTVELLTDASLTVMHASAPRPGVPGEGLPRRAVRQHGEDQALRGLRRDPPPGAAAVATSMRSAAATLLGSPSAWLTQAGPPSRRDLGELRRAQPLPAVEALVHELRRRARCGLRAERSDCGRILRTHGHCRQQPDRNQGAQRVLPALLPGWCPLAPLTGGRRDLAPARELTRPHSGASQLSSPQPTLSWFLSLRANAGRAQPPWPRQAPCRRGRRLHPGRTPAGRRRPGARCPKCRPPRVRSFPQPAAHPFLYSSAPATQPSCDSPARKGSVAERRAARRERRGHVRRLAVRVREALRLRGGAPQLKHHN